MNKAIPSVEDIRGCLAGLSSAEMSRLATQSSVPLPTLMKIRHGQTLNPGLETVRKFFGLLDEKAPLDLPCAAPSDAPAPPA